MEIQTDPWDTWIRVKDRIMMTWSELTEDELEATKGNLSSIVSLIVSKGLDDKSQIVRKLVNLVHSEESGEQFQQQI